MICLADSPLSFTTHAGPVFQINKSNPTNPTLTLLVLDANNQEYSPRFCIEGFGGPVEMPWAKFECDEENPEGFATLELAA